MSVTARRIGAVVLVALAATVPLLQRQLPYVFDGAVSSPGVLNLLALMLVFGALAITYDLLFGYTGLLSFGHALYFAVGVYGTAIALETFELGLGGAVLLVLVMGVVLPTLIGLVCLRVGDIAFAMVTLAFAQAGSIFVARDPFKITGGDLGQALAFRQLPDMFVGVVNTKNLYWLALALVVFVYVVARVAVSSPTGRVWQAIRENEQRVEVLGLRPASYKLAVFVLSSFLATVCGVVYVLVVGGAHPGVTLATFTLTLLVMVVLGGAGRLWGALLGGMIYTYLDHRLGELSSQSGVQDLPAVIRVPMSEPMFLLGVLFVVIVLFFPGGIAGALTKRRQRPAWPLGRGRAGTDPPEAAEAPPEATSTQQDAGTTTANQNTTALSGRVDR
jgi:branched-chain amino acid transport system permease protein